jgi:acetyl esterase/lipase
MTHPRSLPGRLALAVSICLLACASPSRAQPSGPPPVDMRSVPAPAEPDAIPVGTGSAAIGAEQWTSLWGGTVVRNVQRPVLWSFKPAKPNGRAVLVVPGGGYQFVAMEREGRDVAQRLAEAGYTAYVLKYRVAPTPPETADYQRAFVAGMQDMMKTPRDQRPPFPSYAPALEDAQQAMRLVRRLAGETGLQTDRIGYLGFSAGARTGIALVEGALPGTVPHSLGIVYGPQDAPTVAPPLPSMFVVHAVDDPLAGMGDFGLVQRWLKTGQRVELHLYERGGHGFALARTGQTSEAWLAAYLAWMEKQVP